MEHTGAEFSNFSIPLAQSSIYAVIPIKFYQKLSNLIEAIECCAAYGFH